MTATITRTADSATTEPTLILGYATTRASRSIVHDLIDGSIAVTLIPPRPRSGTLQLFYPIESDAWECFDLHSADDTFTLTDTDRVAIGMDYIVTGHRISLSGKASDTWQVDIDYQEVDL